MKKTFVMIFKKPNVLNSMLELRRRGWTYQSLALIFNVDHSSIYKACKIRHIDVPKNPIALDVAKVISLFIKPSLPERPIKTYVDYLELNRKRKFPKLYPETERV